MARLTGLVLAACAAGTLLAACSDGTPSSSKSSTTASGPVTTTSAPTTSTSAASTTTTAGGGSQCPTSKLAISVYGSSGAAGTIETTMALVSSSATPCTLQGYPGMQLLGPGQAQLPTNVVRKGNYSFTAMDPSLVTLSNGQSAYFNLGYSDVPVGNETSCPVSSSVEVTPPNAVDFAVVPAQFGPCGGGTIVVSPVFLATGANAQTMAPKQ